MIRELPIDQIHGRQDARSIDEATVGGLADSIGAVGLINPIRVRAIGDQWEVIAGMHRLAACKRLGLVEISADVIESDDLHAELAMIDENLCRAELSPSDRAKQTARRKAIYLELHPETAEHVAGGKGNVTAEKFSAVQSFAADTAAKTGQTDRTVRLHAERGAKVIGEVLDMIQGTPLDTGKFMDEIKNFPPNDQFRVAERELARLRKLEREKKANATSISRRVAPLDETEVREKQVAALMAAWNKASAEARQEFLESIDTPVFDRSAA